LRDVTAAHLGGSSSKVTSRTQCDLFSIAQ
jgi:hypothetical protein